MCAVRYAFHKLLGTPVTCKDMRSGNMPSNSRSPAGYLIPMMNSWYSAFAQMRSKDCFDPLLSGFLLTVWNLALFFALGLEAFLHHLCFLLLLWSLITFGWLSLSFCCWQCAKPNLFLLQSLFWGRDKWRHIVGVFWIIILSIVFLSCHRLFCPGRNALWCHRGGGLLWSWWHWMEEGLREQWTVLLLAQYLMP